MKVRPTGTTPSTGNITYSGSGITGVDGSTNFGTLSTVPGTVTKVVFTTQPASAEYGSDLSVQPVIKTQDQFGNNSTSGLGVNNTVTLTLIKITGTGVLQGTASIDIGTSVGNGTATFSGLTVNKIGQYQLTATPEVYASDTSNQFDITSKILTATIGVDNKVYDGTTNATVDLSSTDIISGDVVTFSYASAAFGDAKYSPSPLAPSTPLVSQ